MTLQEYVPIFARLARQLNKTDANAEMIRDHFEALRDLEVEFVALAAERFARTVLNADGQAWFPKTPEWRAMAAKVEAERLEAQRAFKGRLSVRLCELCSDTGWAPDADGRVRPCACRKVRRLELLGRQPQPVPELGPAPETSDGPLAPTDSSALVASLRERGLKPRIRVMRGGGHAALRSRLARLEDAARDVAHPADQADLRHVHAAARSGESTLDPNRSQGDDT